MKKAILLTMTFAAALVTACAAGFDAASTAAPAAQEASRPSGQDDGRHKQQTGENMSPNFALNEREEKTLAAAGASQINVVNFNGPVTVRAWDKSEVSVAAVKRAMDEKAMRAVSLQTEQRGAQVTVSAKFGGSPRRVMFGRNEVFTKGAYVELEVSVPRGTNLSITNDNGPLSVEGVDGEISLRTVHGALEVRGGRGRLVAHTNNGPVRVEGFAGDVDATEMSRRGIVLDGRFEKLKATTGGGTISLALPAGSNLTIETDAPDVDAGGLDVTDAARATRGLRRLNVGAGGNVISLITNNGRLVLRPSAG
jgi:hypothetical protein